MRADRLIAALMVLQTRGKVTAAQLAEELEVSERTARRDLEALAVSGVPLYSTHGRGGGWQLIGGATTDLTGLSADEARALFLAAGPALESAPELKSALRKLTTALPESFRDDALAASAAIKIDPTGWGQIGGQGHSQPEYLSVLTDAVVGGHKVTIEYESPRSDRSKRIVDPLGLVTKRGAWYLITNTDRGGRTFRLDRILQVEALDQPVVRPRDFDLDQAWSDIVTEMESHRPSVECRAHVMEPALVPLRYQFSHRIIDHGVLPDGRHDVTISEFSYYALAAQLAGHGRRVEVIDPPPELHIELRRIAAELSSLYGEPLER